MTLGHIPRVFGLGACETPFGLPSQADFDIAFPLVVAWLTGGDRTTSTTGSNPASPERLG